MHSRRWKLMALAGLFAVFGAACGSDGESAGGDAESQTAVAAEAEGDPNFTESYAQLRESYHHMFATADGLAGAIAKQKDLGETATPAIDTRQTLGRQLGEHALIAAFAMQKGADGDADFDAIGKALDGNSVDLSKTIESVYGAEAGDAFLKQWRDHIRMFVDFTVGTATKDEEKRNAALTELGQYKESFAKFLTENTGLAKDSGLQASAVAGLLQSHVDQLTTTLDSYLEKDYTDTYKKIRNAYHHMYMTADGLAGAIAKQKDLGTTTGAAADTRLTLDRLLGEHAALAAFTMQKGAQSKPDFEAAAAALDANSVDLGATIESVYGKEAGDAFLKQWRDHIRMFVDFTVGTATDDDEKRDAALTELGQYKESFAKFLTENTGLQDVGLEADAVAGLLQDHVNQLTASLDAYLGR